MLHAISPIDGRYHSKTEKLQDYFSEFALIKYRVRIEVEYFLALSETIPQLSSLTDEQKSAIQKINEDFNAEDAKRVKEIEATTNHDVKAVEYLVKEKLTALGLEASLEFVHFGLTSQDVNNTSVPLSLKEYLDEQFYPSLENIIGLFKAKVNDYKGIPLLARTHGQPASPTTLGKEFQVFVERLENQLSLLRSLPIKAKFGGATGNLNAHKISFPNIDWIGFATRFVQDTLGLERSQYTTQIAHYDHLAAIFDCCSRINTILIDFARDIWTYISQEYFMQKINKNEVGSSAMPHKVNPIDFENAEGNLGIANAVFHHLSMKLPISRLQRDLTDSTVLRNIGVPFAHTKIAFKSVEKGLGKILLNESKLHADLEANWAVVAEAIQNILRREAFPKPYEALKALTRNNERITQQSIHSFIENLEINSELKEELKLITPFNYIGYY